MTDTTQRSQAMNDEAELRELIARWSKAVRDENFDAIRADHDPDILMFDVPPPFLSRGLDAYMATWQTFFAWQAKPVEFDFHDVAITAGNDVAFATAIGCCGDLSSGKKLQLEFRLTMGFRKHAGRWRIVHEHHSLPATDAGV
jgi:ketosteroid isomerase-like protein